MRKILAIVCLLTPSLVFAKTLNEYLGHVKSLSARFEQYVFNQTSQESETSKGSITVLSPDRFRLIYNKPYKQEYVADGKLLWSYDEDLEQVTVKKQEGLLANSPAIVLANPANLESVYLVKGQGIKDNIDWFYLTPKQSDSQFDHIRLGFAGNNLYFMELFDSFGSRTQLKFIHLQYNPKVSPADFKFTPPPGVDIVGDTESQ